MKITPEQIVQNDGRLTFEFHQDDAEGKIVIEPSGPGQAIWAPVVSTEQPIALIDLYHASPAGRPETDPQTGEEQLETCEALGGGKPVVMIVIQDPRTPDPLGYARFWPTCTMIDFELDAEKIATATNGTPIMGIKF